MMGLKDEIFYLSWFITYSLQVLTDHLTTYFICFHALDNVLLKFLMKARKLKISIAHYDLKLLQCVTAHKGEIILFEVLLLMH